jgi:hypothetical protein
MGLHMFRAALLASLSGLLLACGNAARLEVVSDECLSDPLKITPGVCGCGIPEDTCSPLLDALRHRYAFNGFGTVAVDDIAHSDGTIKNAQLNGAGQLDLVRDSVDEQYVELPNGIISVLLSATFEGWVVWTPPPAAPKPFWERIFDFGVSMAGEDLRDHGRSYLFFAPGTPNSTPPEPRTAFRDDALGVEVTLDSTAAFPTNTETHFAVVVDVAAEELRLYFDGDDKPRVTKLAEPLSAIDDVNNWLGRSQFAADTRFGGSFLEFRIYDEALTPEQLEASKSLGPSPFFLQPLSAQDATDAP